MGAGSSGVLADPEHTPRQHRQWHTDLLGCRERGEWGSQEGESPVWAWVGGKTCGESQVSVML